MSAIVNENKVKSQGGGGNEGRGGNNVEYGMWIKSEHNFTASLERCRIGCMYGFKIFKRHNHISVNKYDSLIGMEHYLMSSEKCY